MTSAQKNIAKNMREDGKSYAEIADLLDLSKNTIKSYCQRNNLHQLKKISANITYCKQCGQKTEIIAGRKQKKFCADKCRADWWAANPNKLNRKAVYNFICAFCGTNFSAYGNKGRKFCKHACYIADRFGKNIVRATEG
ncbi:MAG: RNA polymerase subunit sigma-70 [Defluviitaleaceae bacterium]|nr:RNA polymerase subunit sigma-70 [Defluviitaleaceae bacterium]